MYVEDKKQFKIKYYQHQRFYRIAVREKAAAFLSFSHSYTSSISNTSSPERTGSQKYVQEPIIEPCGTP